MLIIHLAQHQTLSSLSVLYQLQKQALNLVCRLTVNYVFFCWGLYLWPTTIPLSYVFSPWQNVIEQPCTRAVHRPLDRGPRAMMRMKQEKSRLKCAQGEKKCKSNFLAASVYHLKNILHFSVTLLPKSLSSLITFNNQPSIFQLKSICFPSQCTITTQKASSSNS